MPSEPWYDVHPGMLPVLRQRSPLPVIRLDTFDPGFGRLFNGDAFARRRMHPLANVNLDGGMIVVGVLLVAEGLNVPFAAAIGIVNDPCLLGFTLRCRPSPSPY